MRPHVVGLRRLNPAHRARIEADCTMEYFHTLDATSEPAFARALCRADGLIGAKLALPPTLLAQAARLKVISTISAGTDNLPLPELGERGITVCNTPDALTETTADLAFALMLGCARRIVELDSLVRRGEWTGHVEDRWLGTNIHGKTLGIVGAGRIGRAIARRGALGFGMSVRYACASRKHEMEAELGARHASLDTLLAESDIVCVALPLTPETTGLMNATAFAAMRTDALFINIARGGIVDETALIEALEQRRIRGAGLDVYAKEPLPPASPLQKLANVILLPHVGSATAETRHAMADRAVDNLLNVLSGKPPLDVVIPR